MITIKAKQKLFTHAEVARPTEWSQPADKYFYIRSYSALKRLLLIFSDRIFDSRVDRGIPNLTAAPVGPNIRPRLSFRAASIISFSCASRLRGSSIWFFDSVRDGCFGNQLSSIEKISVSQSITERSMTFCSSRMFPGQGYN